MRGFIIILVFLLSVSDSLACTCVNTTNISDKEHSGYLKKVKAIFYGEVVSLGEKREVSRRGRNFEATDIFQPVKFRVLRAWKGVESAEITVETDAESSCRYVPSVGNRIMIYAYEDKPASIQYFVNYCSVGVFDDEKMKREYGEGTLMQPAENKEISTGFWTRLWDQLVSYFV